MYITYRVEFEKSKVYYNFYNKGRSRQIIEKAKFSELSKFEFRGQVLRELDQNDQNYFQSISIKKNLVYSIQGQSAKLGQSKAPFLNGTRFDDTVFENNSELNTILLTANKQLNLTILEEQSNKKVLAIFWTHIVVSCVPYQFLCEKTPVN